MQVLRLQPGDALVLFNGDDGADWPAEIVRIGRREIDVRLGAPLSVRRELACEVTLAVGVPANDRMDALVEKASELGAAAIQPLVCERSVVRLSGPRAAAKRAHWQAVATAASEQCGRARVAGVRPVASFSAWLDALAPSDSERRVVLSLAPSALDPAGALGADALRPSSAEAARSSAGHRRDAGRAPVIVLSGPEGGLSPAEESAALARGFVAVSLGPRTLRADTAPLALLAWLGLSALDASATSR